jgi:hypothetical protein
MDLNDLKLEDLVKRCEKCDGSAWLREYPQQSSTFGTNLVMREGPCPDCEQGYVYTPLGRVLREFVRVANRV